MFLEWQNIPFWLIPGWPNWTKKFWSANLLPIQSKKIWLVRPIANPIQSANWTPIGTNCQSADWSPIGFWPIGSQLPIGKLKMALYLSYKKGAFNFYPTQ